MKQPSSLLRTVGSIGSATSLSRVLGLVRDMVQSYYFGAGPVTDAFTAAYRVPSLFRDLFAEGVLSSAFVPALTAECEQRGRASAWRLANRLFTAVALVLGMLGVAVAVGARSILAVYVVGFPPEKLELAVTMTRVLSPFLLFVALAAVAMGVLNTCGRFFVPSAAPAAFNVATIVGVVALVPLLRGLEIEPGLSLAIGALVGGVMQFLVQVPAMRTEGFRFRLAWAWKDPVLRRIVWWTLPATFGLAVTQINVMLDTALASIFDDGPITYLSLAFRLIQLPIGLFGVALGTATLARVSRDAACDDHAAMRTHMAAALRMAAVLIVPATSGLIALRVPIVRVLFEHGRFDAEDTRRMAGAVFCYAVGLVAYALTKVQAPTYYALGETREPVLAAASSVLLKVAVGLLLIAWLPRLGCDPFLGLALSTSLAAWFNFGWLSMGLRRRVGRLAGHRVGECYFKLSLLSLLMGAVCASSHALLERSIGGGGLTGDLARLATAIALGIAIVAFGVRAFDLPESELLFRHRRRG